VETNVAVPYNGTSYTTNITTLTTYIGGFVYQSKTYSNASLAPINEAEALQLFSHEEGRVRFKPAVGTAPATFAFDYFIKDHLGNVRMVLTDDKQTDIYPVASLEPSKLATEKNYYDIKDAQISLSSAATGITSYTNDNGIGNNPPDSTFSAASSTKLYRLNSNEAKTGLGITLKVMAGDKIDVFGKSYYFQNTTGTSGNSTLPVLDLLTAFLNAPAAAASTAVHGLVTPAIINTPTGTSAINTMMGIQNTQSNATPTKPRAFINVIFFDEQFKAVSYQISMAGSNSIVKDHHAELQNIVVPKNGFVYIYCSNESPVNVFFDNMQVVQTRGPILEETHYYPFGLTMAGISSKAAGKLQNKEKTFQGQQFDDDLGINWIQFKYRNHDPQIGRFIEIDPLASKYVYNSTYAFSENKVTGNVELEGLESAPTEDKRPYPERVPQASPSLSPFPAGAQSGPPASPPQASGINTNLIGVTSTNSVTTNKVTLINNPWLGTATVTNTDGKKSGEEKLITVNTNTVNKEIEGGDVSFKGVSLGLSFKSLNPSLSIPTGNGNEVHLTIPINPVGILINGITLGSSNTQVNGGTSSIDLNCKPGQNTINLGIGVGVAAALFFNPELIPAVITSAQLFKPALQ